jgi:hypothetical protein
MTQPIHFTAGGVRWTVAPEHRELLFGPDGLRLQEWLANGQARVVKQAPHRTVYQVSLPGLRFFLKQNRPDGPRARLREWLRRGKAQAEYDRALAVAARQVPTFTPLAAGEPCQGDGHYDSFLLTRALENTQPLNTFLEKVLPSLPPDRRTGLRQVLAREVGRLLADMHDAGLVHHDLHTGNMLVDLTDEARPRLYLIDLHAVRLGRRLGWRASRDNLVILNRWFILRASRSDRLRFWQAYCARRQIRLCPDRPRELERRTAKSNVRFWHGLELRCMGNNRRFRRVSSAAASGHAVTDLDRGTLDALLGDPDAPFRQPGVRLLKDSRSSTVAELEMQVGGVARKVIYKRFRVTSWKDPWLALLRPTGALRSWVCGHALRLRWLPTPRPLLVLHRRCFGLVREGYLLAAKVEDADDLHEHANRLRTLPQPQRQAALRPLLERVARLVRDLHERHLSQRDLKAVNILVVRRPGQSQDTSAEPYDHWPLTDAPVWLIDLVGVRRHRRLGRRRKVQNLARLHASFFRDPCLSRTDKLRFLWVYLRCGLRGKAGWKDWWREVERATLAKVAGNARRGRPLA